VQKVDIMYHTGSLFEGRFPSETWTGQRGLFTDWDYLFREMITVLLHEKKMQLGMLNPFAEVFVPTLSTNNGNNITNNNKEGDFKNTKETLTNVERKEPPESRSSNTQDSISNTSKIGVGTTENAKVVDNKSLKRNINWIQVSEKKTRAPNEYERECIEGVTNRNYYQILSENEEDDVSTTYSEDSSTDLSQGNVSSDMEKVMNKERAHHKEDCQETWNTEIKYKMTELNDIGSGINTTSKTTNRFEILSDEEEKGSDSEEMESKANQMEPITREALANALNQIRAENQYLKCQMKQNHNQENERAVIDENLEGHKMEMMLTQEKEASRTIDALNYQNHLNCVRLEEALNREESLEEEIRQFKEQLYEAKEQVRVAKDDLEIITEDCDYYKYEYEQMEDILEMRNREVEEERSQWDDESKESGTSSHVSTEEEEDGSSYTSSEDDDISMDLLDIDEIQQNCAQGFDKVNSILCKLNKDLG